MKRQILPALAVAAQASYLHQVRRIADMVAEERALRAALARLDGQAESARGALARDRTMRAIGADLRWQGWEDRTRRTLNTELARVLARKETVLDAVRLAHGRHQAIVSLRDTAALAHRGPIDKRRAAELLSPWLQGGGG